MESTTIYRENAAEQISEQLKPLLSRDIVGFSPVVPQTTKPSDP